MFDTDVAVATKQTTALVDGPWKDSASHYVGEGGRRVEDDRRSSLDEFVGRVEASDGDVK